MCCSDTGLRKCWGSLGRNRRKCFLHLVRNCDVSCRNHQGTESQTGRIGCVRLDRYKLRGKSNVMRTYETGWLKIRTGFFSCGTTPDYCTSENFGDLKPLGDLRTRSSHGLSLRFVVHRSSGHYQQKAVSLSHGIGAVTTFQDLAFSLTVRTRNVACILEVGSFLRDLSGLQELGGWAERHFTGKWTSDSVLAKGVFSLYWKASWEAMLLESIDDWWMVN